MAKDYLQFLRNETIFEDKKTAIQGLVNKLNSVRANGSPLIATYKDGEDGIVSILFGITYGDGKNYQIFEGSKINSAGDLEIPDSILNEIKNQISLVVGGASDDYNTLKKLEDLINGLRTKLDNTQVGSGLNTDGTYSANTDSNYISNASSLNDADAKLDAEIKKNAESINDIKSYATEVLNGNGIKVVTDKTGHTTTVSINIDETSEPYLTVGTEGLKLSGITETLNDAKTDINSELAKIKTSVGLGEDYIYVKPEGAVYITGATSVKEADKELDAQIKKNADAINTINREISEIKGYATEVASGNGIEVSKEESGHTTTVSVKKDGSSEDYLTVGPDGIKVSGITDAINSSKTEIGNHTVNTKPISSNPVLNGGDIKLDDYKKSTGETTVIESGDTVNSAIGKLEKSIEDNKVSVLATTGDSETAVMSQKAVTTETELVRYLKTKTTVETLQNLPTDYYLILANINNGTSGTSLTISGSMKDMQEIHIIVHNTNPKEMLTIALPSSSNYINTTETSVSVLANEYCEINMISDGTNTYIRAI